MPLAGRLCGRAIPTQITEPFTVFFIRKMLESVIGNLDENLLILRASIPFKTEIGLPPGAYRKQFKR